MFCLAVLTIVPSLWAKLPPLASSQPLLFENEYVRVTELRMAPGESEPEHQHARGVTVALGPYDNEIVALPAHAITKRHTDFGEVRWADASQHSTRNTGTTPQRVIRVELKQEPGPVTPAGPFDSLIVSKDTQRLVLENPDVRVIEELVPPGVVQPKHSHRKSVLIVLADADIEVMNDPGPAFVARHAEFGGASWQAPSLHTVKNAGKSVMRNIRIEVK